MTNIAHTIPESEEFVTIIAPTLDEVMQQFKARGLAAAGYSITGRTGRHQFAVAESTGSRDLFEGTAMVAATFRRSGD